jgi:16S rRNA (adenine1518-N6/adenine1519-N6)-dimethyltransferase
VVHQTKRLLQEKLKERGLWLNKRLGQCFLIDVNMLKKIVRDAQVNASAAVLEIGCGSGMLTQFLAEKAAIVWAVEVDHGLLDVAREMLADCANVVLVDASIMADGGGINPEVKNMIRRYCAENPDITLSVVANLPYYLATSAIMELLDDDDLTISSMTFTVQKEVAERLTAAPGHREYGAASVIAQVNADIELRRILKPNLFWPRPKVDSTLIRVKPDRTRRAAIHDYDFFTQFVKAVFLYRRKKLKKAMTYADFFGEGETALIEAVGFDVARRAEEFNIADFITMSNVIHDEREKKAG